VKKILAIVLARGGSKRIPGKNLIQLGERPLISWTIDFARNSQLFHEVIVSTDSEAIAEIARGSGALVPWLRPQDLSSDEAKSEPAILHALDWFEAEHYLVDGVMLLQPTSPFRKYETIYKALALFEFHPNSAIVSTPRPQSNLEAKESGELEISIDEPRVFVKPNGNLYLFSPEYIRANKTILEGDVVPLPSIDYTEDIDIDTLDDLELARHIQRQNLGFA
jgi:CMP-N,N'-diacetyllegionaminic acid synthase